MRPALEPKPPPDPADWRLLIDGAANGPWNMAVDDAILDGYAGGGTVPRGTVRLYSWSPAALSLGRSQPASGAFDASFLRAEGIDLVRRATGGLAVLHEHERTFSICASLRETPFDGSVRETYRRVAEALRGALGRLGIEAELVAHGAAPHPAAATDPSCFQLATTNEIAVGGRKLIGAAQVRRRSAFLQHGSILLRADPRRLARALGTPVGDSRFTDLACVLGREPDVAALDRALVSSFSEHLGVRLRTGDLSAAERERATQLYSWKHNSLAWILERRLGSREGRWGPTGTGRPTPGDGRRTLS